MGAIAPPDKAMGDLLGGVGEWLCTAGTSCEAPPGAECSVVGARCSPGYEGEGFVPSSGLGGMLIKVESGSEEVAAGAALCPFFAARCEPRRGCAPNPVHPCDGSMHSVLLIWRCWCSGRHMVSQLMYNGATAHLLEGTRQCGYVLNHR